MTTENAITLYNTIEALMNQFRDEEAIKENKVLCTQLERLVNAVDVLAEARTPMQRIKATRPLDEALKASRVLLGREGAA